MSHSAIAIITTLAVFCTIFVAVVVFLTYMLVKSYRIYQKLHHMLRAQKHKIMLQDSEITLRDSTLKALLLIFMEVVYGDPKEMNRRATLLRSDMSLLEFKTNTDSLTPEDICNMMVLTEGADVDKALDILHRFFEEHLSRDAELRESMSEEEADSLDNLVYAINEAKKSREDLSMRVEFDHALLNELMELAQPEPAEVEA